MSLNVIRVSVQFKTGLALLSIKKILVASSFAHSLDKAFTMCTCHYVYLSHNDMCGVPHINTDYCQFQYNLKWLGWGSVDGNLFVDCFQKLSQ